MASSLSNVQNSCSTEHNSPEVFGKIEAEKHPVKSCTTVALEYLQATLTDQTPAPISRVSKIFNIATINNTFLINLLKTLVKNLRNVRYNPIQEVEEIRKALLDFHKLQGNVRRVILTRTIAGDLDSREDDLDSGVDYLIDYYHILDSKSEACEGDSKELASAREELARNHNTTLACNLPVSDVTKALSVMRNKIGDLIAEYHILANTSASGEWHKEEAVTMRPVYLLTADDIEDSIRKADQKSLVSFHDIYAKNCDPFELIIGALQRNEFKTVNDLLILLNDRYFSEELVDFVLKVILLLKEKFSLKDKDYLSCHRMHLNLLSEVIRVHHPTKELLENLLASYKKKQLHPI